MSARIAAAILALCCWAGLANAQSVPLIPVTQGPTEQQASVGVCATAPAINTQTACTLPALSGYSIYINYLQVGICGDNTANAANNPQLTFTSTNLGGWTQQISFLQGGTIATTGSFISCIFAGGLRTQPLKAASPGVAVVITPPTAQAHTSYNLNVEYYYATP